MPPEPKTAEETAYVAALAAYREAKETERLMLAAHRSSQRALSRIHESLVAAASAFSSIAPLRAETMIRDEDL